MTETSEKTPEPSTQWWGQFSFEGYNTRQWDLQGRSITVKRELSEWRIWDRRSTSESSAKNIRLRLLDGIDCPPQPKPEDETLIRLLQQSSVVDLFVLPALADRFIVISPATPLNILAGETATLYVSTPLWFTIRTSEAGKPVIDLPFWRPSDSWFGPSTREGEMCYAKYTDARLDLTTLERRQHRAITPVQVINKSADVFAFERINIPVPLLTLYADDDRQLWTNKLTLTRNDDKEVEVDIAQSAPFKSMDQSIVNVPRIPSERRTLMRNLSSLFA